MTEQSAVPKAIQYLIFFLCGIAIWVIPLMLMDMVKVFYQVVIVVVLLLLWFSTMKNEKISIHSTVFYAFFIAAVATILATPFGGGTTVEDRTIRVVISTFLVVVPILALTILSGENLASIYLKRGNLRKGLFIGGIAFIIFLVTAIPASEIFGANPVTTDQLVLWAPWIIVFIMFNSLREELWFRGIFLRKYAAHFGEDPGNLLQALLFGAAHLVFPITMLNITGNLILFILPFFIGLASGAAMYKTDSILAAFLIHAGADIPFLIAAFSMI